MAYDKHTWTCNEPITVERLNHIEDGIANAGGDCDCGYECTETLTTLTEETVTTVADGDYISGMLSYSQLIDADTITVTFNGTVYECEKTIDAYGGSEYGAPYDDTHILTIGLNIRSTYGRVMRMAQLYVLSTPKQRAHTPSKLNPCR